MPGAAIKKGAGVALNALRGGTAAGAQGAAYGFGAGEDSAVSRAHSAGIGAGVGAAAGAAAPYALRGVQRAVDRRKVSRAGDAAAKTAPSLDDLRTRSSALYSASRARGVEIKPEVVQRFADDVTVSLADEGLDPILTPRAARAVERVQAIADGGKIEWKNIELARRVAGLAAKSPDPNERRLAGMVSEKVDDFVLNLMDEDLSAGSAEGLAPEIAEARALWSQMRNSERLAGAIESAGDAASGFENGLRVEFRKLIKDKKFFRTLSEPERQAVREVVRVTPTGMVLRTVAGLSFGSGNRRNILGGLGGSTAGGFLGGPVGAIAVPAAGYAAERAGEAMTLRTAQRAQGLVAAGGVKALPPPADLMLLENALRRSGGAAMVPGVNYLSR